jgi:glycosyltransferase involved in cell wall biosynthesis
MAWRASSHRAVATDTARLLRLAGWADVVVLHRPNLPDPILRIVRRQVERLVVDFDDALWASRSGRSAGEYGARLASAVEKADLVIAGSNHLASRVSRFDGRTIEVLRPSVDLEGIPRHHHSSGPIVVGWLGTDGNVDELRIGVLGAVEQLGCERCTLRVLAGTEPSFVGGNVEFEQWTLSREGSALSAFDVGVLPLNDDERSRGRCAYKAIQYMAAGVPVVASPVGAAPEVVTDGENGFLAAAPKDWVERLAHLAGDPQLRTRMGQAGREWVRDNASTAVVGPLFAQLVLDR